jgi:hypothetical protein
MARKRPGRKPKYTGALAQPIYVDLDQLDDEHQLKEVWHTQTAEKLPLLFKHYKIDPSDEQSLEILATCLALSHVPGMQLALRPKRRPRTWKAGLGVDLVRAVEDVKSRTGKGTEAAIAELKEQSGGMWKRYTVENLGARYREAMPDYREAKRREERFRNLVEETRELRARGKKLDPLRALLLTDENYGALKPFAVSIIASPILMLSE